VVGSVRRGRLTFGRRSSSRILHRLCSRGELEATSLPRTERQDD